MMGDMVPGNARLAGVRILAVDDNEVNRLVLEALAVHEGAIVTSRDSGLEAVATVERLGGAAFDVVLTDIQMPLMDGYEVCRRMRHLAPTLPVLGITAHCGEEAAALAANAGMRECLGKPLDLAVLIAAVRRHLPLPGKAATPEAPALLESPAHSPEQSAASTAGVQRVNWALLEGRYAGKPAFLARLLSIPGQKHADRPDRLRAAARAGDWETLRELAHSTKGMAGELYAEELRAMALETEMAARDARADARERGEALADAFVRFLDEVARRLGATAPRSN